jgi:hypothetical protein
MDLGNDFSTLENRLGVIRKILHGIQSMGGLVASIKPEFLLSKNDFMMVMRAKLTDKFCGLDYFNAPRIETLDQKMIGEFKASKPFSNGMVESVKILEGKYASLSLESWMILIMQLFKLFIIGRVNSDKLSSIPGYSETLKRVKAKNHELYVELTKQVKGGMGNIHSGQEIALLKWATVHYGECSQIPRTRMLEFAQMGDGVPVAFLLKSHLREFH